ncbi:MAG: hypothetical protein ACMXX8_00075 [Candidatus Woesearchaeota archaeon]
MVKKTEKLKEIDELILRYNVKEKINEKDLKIDEKKEQKVNEISELAKEETDKKEIESVDYQVIKDDIERLESYQDLMKNYKLNEEQKEAISEIYNRAKENEVNVNDSSYKSISESVKELSNLSKRVMNEISGNYIKSIDEYRTSP